ncbi:MAG TPA: amino acid adenylation domain-containing protein [Polyangia bacterium]|nr:amino acid adenylation domain-containing protein [Polyangia bacterium]
MPLPSLSASLSASFGRDPGNDADDLVTVIARTVARRPHHLAVDGPDARLTYAELDRLSNQLANRFIAAGVGRDGSVGISMPRGAGELVAMLATSKAGGAYVPLDPSHPLDRLQIVLEDAQPQVMVVHPTSPLAQSTGAPTVIVLDDLARVTEGYDATPPAVTYDPAQLAYVLFTSGSTGRPKGVEIPRGAFANFIRSMEFEPGLVETDRLLAVSTTSFDIAGLELFLPLCVGATVVIADRATVMDPRKLRVRLENEGITMMQATPATWRLLLESGWQGHAKLRMLCGGEALSGALADRLLAGGGELWNMYGPTETTVWSSLHLMRPGYDRISIGKPIDRTQIYVLDAERNLLPVGEVGELYIGGHGLARGYRGRADLTADRFIQNPSGPRGDLIYRTGDLGRMSADGSFECLGRIDHQVKIRGYRIELGEIESVLRKVPDVREVLVVAEDQDGDPKLCAYWVGKAGRDAMVEAARKALPAYMVPAAYVPLEVFPLTPNGKIDRKGLPHSTAAAAAEPAVALKRPSDDTQTRLASIWSQILGRDQIGVDQDFFTLGGTSVLAVEICVRIEKETGVEIPLATFFESPTIEKLAPYVSRARAVSSPDAPIVVDLRRHSGSGEPLFCLLGIHIYQDLALALPGDRPVVGMHLPFRYAPGSGQRPTVPQMAAGYIELIRRRQPHGPYHLAGLCFGGVVAYEVARQLEAQGETVALVAVFDGALPSGVRTDKMRKLTGYARLAVNEPARVRSLAREKLGRLRDRLLPPPPAPAGASEVKLIDVEIDGPDADAEVSRFAQQVSAIAAPLLIFRALDDALPSWIEVLPHMGWAGLSDRLVTCDIHASHLGILHDAHVQLVAKAITDAIPASPAERQAASG